jgi:hypothetical protein
LGFLEDIGKLRDEVKVKESPKNMGKKKQGVYPPTSLTQYPKQDTEKLDDAKARARIKAQIKADKREREDPEGGRPPSRGACDHICGRSTETGGSRRLEIRMASGGQLYVTTLSSDASECIPRSNPCSKVHGTSAALREVAEHLAGQVFAVDVETVTFAMKFPRFVTHFTFPDGHCTNEYFLENNSLVPIFRECCMNLG